MNWTIFAVITVVAIFVPMALIATFASTKDTYQYARHYGERGFSPEIDGQAVNSGSVELQSRSANDQFEPPIVEWPIEL